jgi:hypothetical protein
MNKMNKTCFALTSTDVSYQTFDEINLSRLGVTLWVGWQLAGGTLGFLITGVTNVLFCFVSIMRA